MTKPAGRDEVKAGETKPVSQHDQLQAIAPPSPWRRLWRNPAARVSLFVLAFVTLAAFIGPLLLPAYYAEPGANQYQSPTLQHPFGTDLNGRDLLYRVMTGAQVSLLVGLCGACVSLFIGVCYGMISGFAGGKTDFYMMRTVDVLYAIPRLIFILIAISAFDDPIKQWLNDTFSGTRLHFLIAYSKILILILALGLIEWLTMARIVRGQVLALKSQQFIAAAQSLGQTRYKIVVRHLLPNLAGLIVTYMTLTIPAVILDESFLSFLGLGIDAPMASWGSLLNDGAQVINSVRSYWWLLVFPALAMSATLLSLNFLGDGLRDAFDPRGKKRQ